MIPAIYENQFHIPSYFVDDRAELTPNALLSLLQEMSNNHASILGAGWHDLRQKGFFWVITRLQLKIKRMPQWTESVLLRSWVRKSDAATSPRDYEMLDAHGNTLIAGSSVWAILDTAEGHPQRMDQFDGGFLPQERSTLDRKPQKINALQLPDTPKNLKEVLPSDIDMNHHVNNAHYIQWAFDSVNESFRQSHQLQELTVNFLSQAKLGDCYSVYSKRVSDTSYQTTLYSPENRQEYCRILTNWQPNHNHLNS